VLLLLNTHQPPKHRQQRRHTLHVRVQHITQKSTAQCVEALHLHKQHTHACRAQQQIRPAGCVTQRPLLLALNTPKQPLKVQSLADLHK
jgi:hypothetical protein